MPELPEVNTVQKIFEMQAKGRRITHVHVSDDHIIRNADGDEFSEALQGRTIAGSYRRGKYLFAEIGAGVHVQLHLGMTGDIVFYADALEQPPHERFHWVLNDGQIMGFNDPRKFGRILLIDNLPDYLRQIGIGPDALEITEEEFLSRLAKRNTSVKAFLLDQSALAGVGNLYADEICYQVRVHPASTASALPLVKQKAVFQHMQSILQWACDHDAYYGVYPENWFWKWRKKGEKNPNGSGVVDTAKIAGRTTYFINKWQKLYK